MACSQRHLCSLSCRSDVARSIGVRVAQRRSHDSLHPIASVTFPSIHCRQSTCCNLQAFALLDLPHSALHIARRISGGMVLAPPTTAGLLGLGPATVAGSPTTVLPASHT
jgi:hypothetical protein